MGENQPHSGKLDIQKNDNQRAVISDTLQPD
ncbi:hypothetical protein ISM_03695 [Roseovarius nubinhibens ISM]|uniref:Uncharacterized protein n=1 Tax=Roseovarius nubinhibens (strain ATCC BAA-591 / DSM 15170 / ISM) TaxID=89187 RepID=A3SJ31_ROSNI|nr:hypothetical protein ISM_03695 [Roseovarius nubinhibens ISM]